LIAFTSFFKQYTDATIYNVRTVVVCDNSMYQIRVGWIVKRVKNIIIVKFKFVLENDRR